MKFSPMSRIAAAALVYLGLAASLQVFLVQDAWSYVPPSSFIVKSLAAKRGGVKGLRIRSMVTAMEGEQLGTARFKTLTYYNPGTGVIHAYALDERGQKLYAIERREESATAADALLFWRDGQKLANVLKARGVPVRTEEELAQQPLPADPKEIAAAEQQKLARWNSTIAWVIGGESGDSPSLWIEKDTFLPLRLIAPPQPDGDVFELQFEGHRYYREFPYPRTIVALRKKEPLFRDEVQDVLVSLDAGEFKTPLKPGFTEAGEAISGTIRDLIQKYFEVLR